MLLEYSISTKWLELLKEIDPRVSRVAILRDPTLASGSGQFGAIQAVASSFGVGASEPDRDARPRRDRERDQCILSRSEWRPDRHREHVGNTASRTDCCDGVQEPLPAVHSNRLFVTGGGLLSYSPDRIDQFRRSADYVDRILKGEKPADLPVQQPTKYELVINLRTAKALGIEFPAEPAGDCEAVGSLKLSGFSLGNSRAG